jgi:hypothetical protein
MSKGGDTGSSDLTGAIVSGALTRDNLRGTRDLVIMAAVRTASRPFKGWSHWRTAESDQHAKAGPTPMPAVAAPRKPTVLAPIQRLACGLMRLVVPHIGEKYGPLAGDLSRRDQTMAVFSSS